MPTSFDDAVFVVPDKLGYAWVVGGDARSSGKTMTLADAEHLKDGQIRSKLGLEPPDSTPPLETTKARLLCSRCRHPSGLRCSACRVRYCSRQCQAKHWKQHVFNCCVKGRPNDIDHLRLVTTRWHASSDSKRLRVLTHLFSDDDLCSVLASTTASISRRSRT